MKHEIIRFDKRTGVIVIPKEMLDFFPDEILENNMIEATISWGSGRFEIYTSDYNQKNFLFHELALN